jgi:hypothetical protein
MKRLNSFMVNINESQIVELLQNKVRRIIVDADPFVAVGGLDKHFERRSIKKIFPGVDLIAQVAIGLVISVKDWSPALGKFSKSRLDKTGRTRWPGISEWVWRLLKTSRIWRLDFWHRYLARSGRIRWFSQSKQFRR